MRFSMAPLRDAAGEARGVGSRRPSMTWIQPSQRPRWKPPPGKTTLRNSALETLTAIADCLGSASQMAHWA